MSRARIVEVAVGELGVVEDDGKNRDKDGRIAEYWQAADDSRWSVDIGYRPGVAHRNEWCAAFASWVYQEAGLPMRHDHGSGFYGCGRMIQWLGQIGAWRSEHYDPEPGDLIFLAWDRFSWQLDELGREITLDEARKHVCHVGIVELYDAEAGLIYTIEGNWRGGVNRAVRDWESGWVIGFGDILT